MRNKNISDREMRALGALLHEEIAKGLAIQGLLSEDDLADFQVLHEKVKGAVAHLHLSIDYREQLLAEARLFWGNGKFELAHVMYATFFEHSINQIITDKIAKSVTQKSKNEIIKALPLPAKFGWLLELTGLPVFNQKHRATIAQVADLRNAFIHYKFPTERLDAEDKKNPREISEAFHTQIRSAVRYMKAYGTKVVFEGKATKIKNTVRKR